MTRAEVLARLERIRAEGPMHTLRRRRRPVDDHEAEPLEPRLMAALRRLRSEEESRTWRRTA